MSGRARYAAILRAPDVAPLLLASMVARLPYGVYALAAILYLEEARGSYAIAGLVDGAFAVGAAIGVPWQSRLIDRLGQRRVLLPAALLDALATVMLIVLTEADAPTVALVAIGLIGGLAVPSIGGAMRTLWPELLRRRKELLAAAFALDSVAIELLFTVGPLIAALIIAVASPAAALVVSAACSLLGTLAFITRRPSRAWRPHAASGSHGALGALRSAGVRTIVFSSLPVGFCFGAVEISLPAFAELHGTRELAGVLLATWSLASVVGGLAYGARAWPRPLGSLYLWLSLLLPLGYLPALLSPSIAAMALLIVPAGLVIAPLGAAGNQLIERVAPVGAATEAYAWPVTAILIGFAGGTALGGGLVEAFDWRACFIAAAAAAAVGAAVVVRFRGTLATLPAGAG
ncbi:MAG TPA: MFS transporter [Solirubrobacteraceae bacterium]|jgi:MFS family permease|nr:MFS transporter [Solirubrobacteraceae bacterium]